MCCRVCCYRIIRKQRGCGDSRGAGNFLYPLYINTAFHKNSILLSDFMPERLTLESDSLWSITRQWMDGMEKDMKPVRKVDSLHQRFWLIASIFEYWNQSCHNQCPKPKSISHQLFNCFACLPYRRWGKALELTFWLTMTSIGGATACVFDIRTQAVIGIDKLTLNWIPGLNPFLYDCIKDTPINRCPDHIQFSNDPRAIVVPTVGEVSRYFRVVWLQVHSY